MYRQINTKIWLNQEYKGFKDFLIPFKKELSNINITESLYKKRRQELELDNLNLLYVTLTRAKEHLYVVTDATKLTNKEVNYFSQYFKIEQIDSKRLIEEDINVHKDKVSYLENLVFYLQRRAI